MCACMRGWARVCVFVLVLSQLSDGSCSLVTLRIKDILYKMYIMLQMLPLLLLNEPKDAYVNEEATMILAAPL